MKWLRNLKCLLVGHVYRPDVWFDENVQKIKCITCGKKFGINHSVKAVIDWDSDLERAMKIIYPKHEYFKENNV